MLFDYRQVGERALATRNLELLKPHESFVKPANAKESIRTAGRHRNRLPSRIGSSDRILLN